MSHPDILTVNVKRINYNFLAAKFWRIYIATKSHALRLSHDSLENNCENPRLSGEKIKLSDIRENAVILSDESFATVIRITRGFIVLISLT